MNKIFRKNIIALLINIQRKIFSKFPAEETKNIRRASGKRKKDSKLCINVYNWIINGSICTAFMDHNEINETK